MRNNSDWLFYELIGWDLFYPPSDKDIAEEYDAAPEPVQKAYNQEGIGLEGIAPGEELWFGGPRAKRWTIGLHPDWSVFFGSAVECNGGQMTDEVYHYAYQLALAVERACDRDLEQWLEEHPEYNEEGVLWTEDEQGFHLKAAT